MYMAGALGLEPRFVSFKDCVPTIRRRTNDIGSYVISRLYLTHKFQKRP